MKYTVTNEEGLAVSVCQAAADFEVSYHTINKYRKAGFDTYPEIAKKIKASEQIKTRRSRLFKTPFGEISARQAYEIHPYKEKLSIVTVTNRLRERGGMCPSVWWDKMSPAAFRWRLVKEGIATKVYNNLEPITVKFDRSKCMINHRTCTKYKEATDEIVFSNKLPSCYREDRSCYSAPREEFLGGDRTAAQRVEIKGKVF